MQVYKILNLINQKIYIGKDSKNRPQYFGSGIHIRNAIKKYGKENFQKEILEECSTLDELSQREIYWIDKLNSRDSKIGYNISLGGNSVMNGRKHSKESRIKMSLSQKEYNKKTGGHWKGKKHSEETKNKMSKTKKDIFESDRGIEIKQKISKSQTGKIQSEETRKKRGISTSRSLKEYFKTEQGKKQLQLSGERLSKWASSEEGKRKYKELSIKKCKHMYEIDQISLDGNLIKTWKNMLEIREIYPSWSSNISACLNGLRKTTNKFIWKKHES